MVPYFIISFALGLVAPLAFDVDSQVAVTLIGTSATAYISSLIVIFAIENREKEQREKKIDEITSLSWSYIESLSSLTARIVDFYPYKKELLEDFYRFEKKRKKYDELIEQGTKGVKIKDRVNALNEVIEERNAYVQSEGEEAQKSRKYANEEFRDIRREATISFGKGFRAADVFGVWGDAWANNKDIAKDFCEVVRSLRKEVERVVVNATSRNVLELPQNEVREIEAYIRKLRTILVVLNRKEFNEENEKSGKAWKWKKVSQMVLGLMVFFFLGSVLAVIGK